jgi:hypothetical protein
MATFLSKMVADPHSSLAVDLPMRGRELQALVNKYTQDFPARVAYNGSASPVLGGNVYLLTGTTGGLGSNMLARLLEAPAVTRVYAFNRPTKSSTSQGRHLLAFRKRGLNTGLLASEKLVYVEGDLSAPCFALGDRLYGEVSSPPGLRLLLYSYEVNHRSMNLSPTSFITVC